MKRLKIKALKGESTSEELQLAIVMRLLAKAIHRLQMAGEYAKANELIEEANSFGIHIVIMGDASKN